MNCLEKRIMQDGIVKSEKILKVDSFLNHQIDVLLLEEMAELFYDHFKNQPITKVVTIEASGIAIGAFVAHRFRVPLLFAKKSKTSNLNADLYHAPIFSFTHQTHHELVLSKDFLQADDHVLLIDDFLASGSALNGLLEIVKQSQASLAGIGIAIEKGFQKGGEALRQKNIPLYSLAIVDKMNPETQEIQLRG